MKKCDFFSRKNVIFENWKIKKKKKKRKRNKEKKNWKKTKKGKKKLKNRKKGKNWKTEKNKTNPQTENKVDKKKEGKKEKSTQAKEKNVPWEEKERTLSNLSCPDSSLLVICFGGSFSIFSYWKLRKRKGEKAVVLFGEREKRNKKNEPIFKYVRWMRN